jgi:hypothetical protein
MSEGQQRPGGLTAMAVINFVGAAFNLFQIAGLGFLLHIKSHPEFLNSIPDKDQAAKMLEAAEATPLWYLYGMIALDVVFVAVLIAAGVGYLKLKRKQGWLLGNVWAATSLVTTIAQLVIVHASFTISLFIMFLYPLVTLGALNTTFKQDFVNP